MYEAVGALSPDGLVGETPLINLLGRGCSLIRWVGGRDSTNTLSSDGLVGEIHLCGFGGSLTRWVGGRDSTNTLSSDGLVGEIHLCGFGGSLTRWVGGRDSTNKYIGPWVLSYQMGWWESLH